MLRSAAGHPWAGTLGVLVAGALLAGCGVPIPPEVPDTSATGAGRGTGGDVDRLVPLDTRTEELTAALDALGARVEEARRLLEAGEDAVGVLLGPPGGGNGPGVLPAVAPDRAGAASDDLVTALITLAGDVGGERGRIVLELARDPMLGDLGVWQRDPLGMIAALRTIADEAADGDAPALDAALAELPGELTRALGYALVVAGSDDAALVRHAATQGSGRLAVVLVAVELGVERIAAAR